MKNLKESFIRLALECGALKFGDFILKSGRKSPYFFNAGLFYQGKALRALGQFYANALVKSSVEFQHLFGPAYKGLPIATATAIALAEMDIETTVTFNRKETKDHGEGGQLIGAPLSGNTVIVDDVITAGTAFKQSRELITANGANVSAVIIALDRCEKGEANQSTLKDIQNQGISVISLITLFDLIDYLKEQHADKEVEQLLSYQQLYGI